MMDYAHNKISNPFHLRNLRICGNRAAGAPPAYSYIRPMKNVFILPVLTLMLASCNSQPANHVHDSVAHDTAHTDTSITGQVPLLPVPDSLDACFSHDSKNEYRYMHLWRDGISVHGDLQLRWDNKREVSGTFEGNIINDTMWIMHKFISEGKKMKREMVYILSGDKLYEGQGMQETKDDVTFTFKNRKMLEFSKEPAMVKVDCE
jgi:hypothetical protein